MSKYITEFIGTFFLVLSISLAVITEIPLAPLAIGSILIAMIYMGGHISGAHYNPVVSVAMVMRGAMGSAELLPYIGAQLAAATVAALIGNFIADGSVPIAPGNDINITQALLVEIFFTFALVLTILNVAIAERTKGNQYYGLAIGLVVICGAFAGGGISGAAFNPAVGIGLSIGALVAGTGGGSFWLYIIGPFIGGIAAAYVFGVQEGAAR